MSGGYSQFWQDEEWADVEVLLVADQSASDPAAPKQLAKFPGHRVFLSSSPYLRAQLQRWQRKRAREDTEAPADTRHIRVELSVKPSSDAAEQPVSVQLQLVSAGSETATQSAQLDHGQPQLVLTLQDADEQPAAMAVLGSLYHIKPLPELLSNLTQVQQLQAAVLADMWEVPDVSTEVVQLLLAAANSNTGLTEQLALHYAHMPAVPCCLAPLLQKVVTVCLASSSADVKGAGERALLSVLGDFGAVWADKSLLKVLLELPLPMMELLLASDQLKVDSEATVLYTAQYYVDSLAGRPQADAIVRLGPLVRCQHLSLIWLSAVASADALVPPGSAFGGRDVVLDILSGRHKFVLVCQVKLVQQLMKLKVLDRNTFIKDQHEGWPASWFQGSRLYKPQDSVQIAWQVDVSDMREAAIKCADSKVMQRIKSDSSAPIRGFAARISLNFVATSEGVKIGVYVGPSNIALYRYTEPAYNCTWDVAFHAASKRVFDLSCTGQPITWSILWGYSDGFQFGCMQGGWDDTVWAAAGMPASGTLTITCDLKYSADM